MAVRRRTPICRIEAVSYRFGCLLAERLLSGGAAADAQRVPVAAEGVVDEFPGADIAQVDREVAQRVVRIDRLREDQLGRLWWGRGWWSGHGASRL